MKALIVLVILVTLLLIFLKYKRDKNVKKLLISLATFGMILSLAVLSNLTRQVMPLFLAHIVLLIFSWLALIWYVFKEKYYWWILFSPLVTLALFLLLEFVTGSGHEIAIYFDDVKVKNV